MHRFQTISGLQTYLSSHWRNRSIGLVPTMGALHPGHLSLIENARKNNEIVVVSIFVNPLQFAPTEDLDRYPHAWEEDCQRCEQLGVDAVFAPSPEEFGISEKPVTTVLPPKEMISGLCGAFRPGHFEGVATIVSKLFHVVQPTRAYFGQKDAQQLAIIRHIVADLNLPVEICAVPTVRESSGLAYSSRNQYLTPLEKEKAAQIFQSLQQAKQGFDQGISEGSKLKEIIRQTLGAIEEIQIQYVELVDPITLTPLEKIKTAGLLAIACYLSSTRLIDNLLLSHKPPIIAIDGPAGAGKSTVTRQVAQQLGLLYLDTGAMYRAVTWLVLQAGIAVEDEPAIAELTSQAQIELIPNDDLQTPVRVKVNGEDITQAIRTPEVTAKVSAVARLQTVRQQLVRQQQRWGQAGGVVAEGRDIGTHVFPNADLKIFLTASVQERAKRRLKDLQNKGYTDINLVQLEQDIQNRDRQDSTRKIAPLCKAPGAIEVNTDGLTIEAVVDKIIQLANG